MSMINCYRLDDPAPSSDVVILIHGLFSSPRSMRTAKMYIERSGFLAVNWGYPTFWRSAEQHANALASRLYELERDASVSTINFLTHSMGGILARYALQLGMFAKVRRVVMLAPPNGGSQLAGFSLGPFARVLPAIAELSEAPDSLTNRLSEPRGIEVGIIAASSDFVVRVAKTILPNQSDHCVIEATHFELPRHEEALQKATRFLRIGRFDSKCESLTAAAERAEKIAA